MVLIQAKKFVVLSRPYFFNEVYTSMKNFADVAVPFWSGAQMSNAKLGMAHAATLK